MTHFSKLNRREFLRLTGLSGAGLMLQASISQPAAALGQSASAMLNVFVHIASNNRVTIVAHRSEMGQGIRTSLPQVVADELEADWDKVDILQAPGDQKYGDQETDGSHSVRDFFQPMREMGASAKLMLRQAAAERWQVPLAECSALNHRVEHSASGRSLSYGELAEAAAQQPLPDPKSLSFKAAKDYRYIGKPMPMKDLQAMLCGAANYGIDTRLPGMVYASIERCPVLGGKLKRFDASKAKQVAGVLEVIKIDGGSEPAGFSPLAGVAVIASNSWAALQGRKALQVSWETGAHASYDSRATIAGLAASAPAADAKLVRQRGDLEQAFASAAQQHEAVYSIPHLEHATLEPLAATVRISGGLCEVWACVQSPQGVREHIASLLGLKQEQVKVNVTLLGGAFGRKAKSDFVAEAALLAKATGKPVKVTWSREDCTRHGYYHAYSVQHYRAALDNRRQLVALDATVTSPSISSLFQPNANYLQDFELAQGFANAPCEVPQLRFRNAPASAHTRIGWLRSVYNINHAFAYNSFIDELARMNQRDPLEFQLATLGSDRQLNTSAEGFNNPIPADFPFSTGRLKQVLRTVQQSCGWPAPAASGEGWGIAAHSSFLSYVAVATKVSLAQARLSVLEVHIAIDCGQILNPDRVRSQMEGAVIFGLSAALMGEISFKQGAVEQSSFDDYPLLRSNQCPKIVVTLVPSEEKHSGVGEPGVPPIAASLTNAIAAAGGPRIRALPISRHLNIA